MGGHSGGGGRAGRGGGGGLSQSDINAIQNYGQMDYMNINKYLREGPQSFIPEGTPLSDYQAEILRVGKDIKPKVDALESALDKTRLRQAETLYRGFNTELPYDIKPGSIITEHGFASTSLRRDVAEGFAKDGYVAKITAPKGTKGVRVSDLGLNKLYTASEDEILLQRGTRFKVTKTYVDKSGTQNVEMKVVR